LLFWSGPIGLGIFFAGLGYFIKALAFAKRLEKVEKTKDSSS